MRIGTTGTETACGMRTDRRGPIRRRASESPRFPLLHRNFFSRTITTRSRSPGTPPRIKQRFPDGSVATALPPYANASGYTITSEDIFLFLFLLKCSTHSRFHKSSSSASACGCSAGSKPLRGNPARSPRRERDRKKSASVLPDVAGRRFFGSQYETSSKVPGSSRLRRFRSRRP